MYFNFVTSAYARHSERFRPPRSYFHKLSNTNLIMKRSSLLFRTCIGWLLFGVLFLQSSYAQDSNSTNSIAMHAVLSDGYFKPQSPDVWSMIKYGDANIDYYSGRLGLNIPIYTYDDPAFKIPISIDYASNGFQPGASIGVVGMGWYLNVGGAITREVRGIRDDAIKETFDWRWGANENETLKWYIRMEFSALGFMPDLFVSMDMLRTILIRFPKTL